MTMVPGFSQTAALLAFQVFLDSDLQPLTENVGAGAGGRSISRKLFREVDSFSTTSCRDFSSHSCRFMNPLERVTKVRPPPPL